jgi:hypothetical protein
MHFDIIAEHLNAGHLNDRESIIGEDLGLFDKMDIEHSS